MSGIEKRPGPSPKVTVVVLNYNGKADTIECLRSLEKLSYPDRDILLVDNGSEDGSPPAVRELFPGVTVIENRENLGYSEGNNVGIRYALENGSSYILLLNNDTVVTDEHLLESLIDFAESTEKAGAVGPKILYWQSERVWFAGGRVSYLTGLCRHIGKGTEDRGIADEAPRTVDYISGCCLLMSIDVLSDIGLLDPDYFLYYEDTDLCFRAKRSGYENYIVPSCVIYHKKSASTGFTGENRLTALQAYYFARNAVLFARKNLHGWKKALFLLAQFTIRLAYNSIMVSGVLALKEYLRGLKDGVAFKLPNKPAAW
ncbi:MAG: glycosyltransferase family 2 protein [Actinomycetia bacterium]|nr:glycosyltransferase family 2 protein [Actinomycetes bacterium]